MLKVTRSRGVPIARHGHQADTGDRARAQDGSWEELPPDPGATIESLRALGYTPGSAVADLIDNSISKDADRIHVRAAYADAESWLAIIDNGAGMSEARLREAMRIGSNDPLDLRRDGDLGRFGFGLKTASFSQARELTVATRRTDNGSWLSRTWDLDEVRARGRWMLRTSAPAQAQAVLDTLDRQGRGTVVLWRRLTKFDGDEATTEPTGEREFRRYLEDLSTHLGMVFGRFIRSGRVTIEVQSHVVKGWDPFIAENPATQELEPENLRVGVATIVAKPFVLPHPSLLSLEDGARASGPNGWNAHQGFYVYRGDRLITAGDWLGLKLGREDKYDLARIAVEVPTGMDEAWKLDIRKSTVQPTDALRADLVRIARYCRTKAAAAKRRRGTTVADPATRKLDRVWVQRARAGKQRLTINRKHPIVAALLELPAPQRVLVLDFLGVVEETVPTLLLPPGQDDTIPLEHKEPEELVRLAQRLYESFLAGGMSRSEARQRLQHTEPFHHYPDVVAKFGGAK